MRVCVCVCAYPFLFSTATLIHIIHQDLDCQIGKVQWHEMHLGISFHPFFYIENVQLTVRRSRWFYSSTLWHGQGNGASKADRSGGYGQSTHRWFALSLAVDLSVACGSRSKVCSNLARARRALAWVSVSLNTTEPFISFI